MGRGEVGLVVLTRGNRQTQDWQQLGLGQDESKEEKGDGARWKNGTQAAGTPGGYGNGV